MRSYALKQLQKQTEKSKKPSNMCFCVLFFVWLSTGFMAQVEPAGVVPTDNSVAVIVTSVPLPKRSCCDSLANGNGLGSKKTPLRMWCVLLPLSRAFLCGSCCGSETRLHGQTPGVTAEAGNRWGVSTGGLGSSVQHQRADGLD